MPLGARFIGLLGLVPFLALAFLSVTETSIGGAKADDVVRAYGAIILSFLGGVQWGLAIRKSGGNSRTRRGLTPTLSLSVAPSLVAWAGLLTDGLFGFGLLILGFALVLISDSRAVRLGMAPQWYLNLRYQLTAVVIGCLTVILATSEYLT